MQFQRNSTSTFTCSTSQAHRIQLTLSRPPYHFNAFNVPMTLFFVGVCEALVLNHCACVFLNKRVHFEAALYCDAYPSNSRVVCLIYYWRCCATRGNLQIRRREKKTEELTSSIQNCKIKSHTIKIDIFFEFPSAHQHFYCKREKDKIVHWKQLKQILNTVNVCNN